MAAEIKTITRKPKQLLKKSSKSPQWSSLLSRDWTATYLLTGLLATAVVGLWPGLSKLGMALDTPLRNFRFESIESDKYWEPHRQEIKDTFITSWDAYAKYAWGQDQFHPLTKTGTQMSPTGLGWIIVDSLDTLMLMNLTTRLSSARK
ncbi:glycoside hydrolase [Aspergillus venezuelensis]